MRRFSEGLRDLPQLELLHLARRGLWQISDDLDAFRPILFRDLVLRHQGLHGGQIEREFVAPVAVLVNNAVFARFEPLAQIEVETVDRMFAVGVHGLIWTTQAVAPQMERRGGGSIVNLSSVSAFNPAKDSIAYSALKAGVVGLSRASAIELSGKKIRVNVIAPGMIGTPASIAQFDEATIATRQAEMPAGRFGEPEEIAALAAFLASDDASYIQGAVITADGGWTIPAR